MITTCISFSLILCVFLLIFYLYSLLCAILFPFISQILQEHTRHFMEVFLLCPRYMNISVNLFLFDFTACFPFYR